MVRLGAATPEELGSCESVNVEEVGEKKVVVFRMGDEETQVATILLRGSTENLLNDLERAIDDGVNTVKTLCRDGRLVAGAGGFEIELARRIQAFAESRPGLEQYAIRKVKFRFKKKKRKKSFFLFIHLSFFFFFGGVPFFF